MKTRIFKSFLVVLCLVSFSISPARAQNEITIIDLGTLGGTESYPFDLNDLGQVVGESYGDAFLWDAKTGMQDLSQILGIYGQAIYINNQGQVVGHNLNWAFLWSPVDGYTQLANTQSYPGGVNNLGQVGGKFNVIVGNEIEQTHAFLWSKATGILDLGTLAGNTWNSEAMAVGINDHGQVVGWSDLPTAAAGSHAFRWTQETGMQDLGFPVTPELFINNNGEIVGSRYIDGSHTRGFLWTPEKGLLDLGTLSPLPDGESEVQGINDQGQVIGWSDTPSGYIHAFLWTPEKGMEDLGTLGGNISRASDINNLGQIVGRSKLPSGESHAFLWTEKAGMIDLGTLEGGDSAAYGINNSGQIMGISDKFYGGNTGFMHAVLWQLPTTDTTIKIKIDIKPGSSINPINLGARGVIPVVVLTTPEFNATTIDPATVLFAGAAPLRWVKQDVDYDGDMDLLFHFDGKKLALTSSSVEASLIGKTFDGTSVEGKDKATIVPEVSYP
jgi:probable HAF family extracellular repeat protein